MKIGISGHQKINPPAAKMWIKEQIRNEMVGRGRITGVSSLAAGADQLFSKIIISLGYDLEIVIPCQEYENTFVDSESLSNYRLLLLQAKTRQQLTFPHPSEEAFLAAGEQVVESSDLMFFIWDERPARGKGGTADIVRYAQLRKMPFIIFNPSSRSVIKADSGQSA